MNSMERFYLHREMSTPSGRRRLRLAACERHAMDILQGFAEGDYSTDMSLREFVEQVLKPHSDNIDRAFDRGGWRKW